MATLSSDADVQVVIPTATNIVLMVSENISSNLRKGQASDIALPSLYKRAFLIVNETDEVALVKQGESG
jgi:hypothetical protein